jgi:putative hydrolase of the HAD superfamily
LHLVRAVVFDLDDTLYLERDYVYSGFQAVAGAVECDEIGARAAFAFLWRLFKAGERGHIFDQLLAAYPAISQRYRVVDLVEIYRTHPPNIRMLPGMPSLLTTLAARGVRFALVTDGDPRSQRAKVNALGIRNLFGDRLLIGAPGSGLEKPALHNFEEVARRTALKPAELVYVGDNPEKDFVAPRRLGWCTIRLAVDGQLRGRMVPAAREYNANLGTVSISELATLLLALTTSSSHQTGCTPTGAVQADPGTVSGSALFQGGPGDEPIS